MWGRGSLGLCELLARAEKPGVGGGHSSAWPAGFHVVTGDSSPGLVISDGKDTGVRVPLEGLFVNSPSEIGSLLRVSGTPTPLHFQTQVCLCGVDDETGFREGRYVAKVTYIQHVQPNGQVALLTAAK